LNESCGDGKLNDGETCDGNSQACTIGGYTGTQSCNAQCNGWNTCVPGQSCGDGVKNGNEACDKNAAGQSCYTGLSGTNNVGICHSGAYPCKQDCTGFDTAICVGQVLPTYEGDAATCWNNLDDDCDGLKDGADTTFCVIGGGGQELPVCENIDVNGDGVYNILDVIVLNDVNAHFTYVVNGAANCKQPYLVIP
jgi:hypothetical protein